MEPNEAVEVETEQLYLYGPNRTRSTDQSKVFRHLQRYMLAMIHSMPLQHRSYCLDYGCGSGYGTELLALNFEYTYGIDKDEKAMEYAKLMHSRSGVLYFPSIEATGLQKPQFDFIACIEAIEHMSAVEAGGLMNRFRDMLDPDGAVVITTPSRNQDAKPNPYHLHEYTVEELEDCLRLRFNVVEVQDISMGMPNLIAICREPKK